MGMLYRKDIFDKHGIEVPEDLGRVRRRGAQAPRGRPGVYLTNLAANQVAAWHGLLWQAGAKPYVTPARATSPSASTTTVSKKLGPYWGALAKEGVVASSRTSPTPGTPPSTRQVRHLAHRRLGPGLPPARQGHRGQVACGPAAAVGRRQAQLGRLGPTTAVIRSTKNPIPAAIEAAIGDTLAAEKGRLASEAQGLKDEIRKFRDEIEGLKPQKLLLETEFRALDEKYGSGARGGRLFHAGMGAEAIRDIITRMDLEELARSLHIEVRTTQASAARRPSSGSASSRRSAVRAPARSG